MRAQMTVLLVFKCLRFEEKTCTMLKEKELCSWLYFHLLGLTGKICHEWNFEKQLVFLAHQFYLNVIIFLAALIGHKDSLIISVHVCVGGGGCLSDILIVENSSASCQAVFVNTTSSSSHCSYLENMALFFCCKSGTLQISINVTETEACTPVCIFSTWRGGIHLCSKGELLCGCLLHEHPAPSRVAAPCACMAVHLQAGTAAPVWMQSWGGWGCISAEASSSPLVPKLESKQVGQLQINNVHARRTSYTWLVLLWTST